MSLRFYFDQININRACHLRHDEPLQPNCEDGTPVFIPIWNDKSLVVFEDVPHAVMLKGDDARWFADNASQVIFLGINDGKRYFVADISHLEMPEKAPLPTNSVFEDLRRLATSIDPEQAGYLAYARALAHWNRTHLYCGRCGSHTESRKSGHERICSRVDCKHSHFPRTDPAVIMLVTHPFEEKCLLGNNKRFQGLRYSTIAGFVEPGESLEQAVTREVKEETGVETSDVTYQASQPWPFPASIMLGFRARGLSTEITCADDELLEAHWFGRDEVHHMASSLNILPPERYSISRWLIDGWLYEK